VTNHKVLLHLFERIHFFLQRLKSYTRIPLTEAFTELLGKIMAQLLSILAMSTKAMADTAFSALISSPLCPPLVESDSGRFMKRLIGRTNVEDALLRLDSLTKEESLMAGARTLEVTHRVADVVTGINDNIEATKTVAKVIDAGVNVTKELTKNIDGNTKVTKALIEEVGDNVRVIEGVTRRVDDDLRANRHRMQCFLSMLFHLPTLLSLRSG
jgi:methyl-accepting chemotaxis protein